MGEELELISSDEYIKIIHRLMHPLYLLFAKYDISWYPVIRLRSRSEYFVQTNQALYNIFVEYLEYHNS